MTPPTFLVIDTNTQSRFLLLRTLLRKFPAAIVWESENVESAIVSIASEELRAVIVHRTMEGDGAALVAQLRAVNSQVPIVMMSKVECAAEVLAAGATRFLNYDEWLRVGTVVAELVRDREKETCPA